MSTYYLRMTANELRDLLDQLEDRLYDYEMEEPDDYSGRRELEDLINNICELLVNKEKIAA